MIILEKIGIPILPHDEAVLPQMIGRLLVRAMLWTRLIHHSFNVKLWPSKPGRLSLLTLIIVLRIGAGHKV